MRSWLAAAVVLIVLLSGCTTPDAVSPAETPEGDGSQAQTPQASDGESEPQPGSDPDPEPEPQPEREIVIQMSRNGSLVSFGFVWDAVPELVFWDFGDGATSSEPTPTHEYGPGNFTIMLRAAAGERVSTDTAELTIHAAPVGPTGFVPKVVVGVADSGFNVYHEVYRRPLATQHPCTYVEGYPCNIPALELTFDAPTWQAAFEADEAKWDAIVPGDRFWIPGTNIIGAWCVVPYSWTAVPEGEDPAVGKDYCILDDTNMHGTGTSSSVMSENPNALLIIAEGKTTAREDFASGEYPVDIISHSWGSPAPTPLPCSGRYSCTPQLFEVTSSGNEGAFPVVLDGAKSHPSYLNIGAADAGSRSEPGYSGWKTMDFVSEYCRPTAQTQSFDGQRDQYCGTSFSAPTFAGALSRILYELRQESGYTGTIVDGVVSPGYSMWDIRSALNHTATYEPEDVWGDGGDTVPLVAPWYQWGWGYVDATRVDAALACIREGDCPERPIETVTYMEALWAYREAAHTV